MIRYVKINISCLIFSIVFVLVNFYSNNANAYNCYGTSNAGTVAIAANALQGALALSTANTATTDAITTQGDLTFNVPQNSDDEICSTIS